MSTTRRVSAAAFVAALALTTACGSDSDTADDDKASDTTVAESSKTTDSTGDSDADADAQTETTSGEDSASGGSPEELMAWIDSTNATIESATDVCDVYSVMSDGPTTEPSDEATGRAAGNLMANVYGKLAELSDIDDSTRAGVTAVVEDMRTEANDPDLNIEEYLSTGPSSFMDDDAAVAAFQTMMQKVATECADTGQ